MGLSQGFTGLGLGTSASGGAVRSNVEQASGGSEVQLRREHEIARRQIREVAGNGVARRIAQAAVPRNKNRGARVLGAGSVAVDRTRPVEQIVDCQSPALSEF